MSKIEASKVELSLIPFDYHEMLSRVISIIGIRAQEKGLSFKVQNDGRIPHALIGYDQRLAQVLTNLLSNAVKFTPEQGEITLAAKLLNTQGQSCVIQIDVTDTGIGITPEQQARLFRPFEQAESSTTRQFGGTGLGLAISKKIVEMMCGEIWVNSTPGEGSTFSFTFRAEIGTPPKAEAAASTGAAEKAAGFKGKTLLLAEDVEINREIVITLLEPTGIRVVCAEDGEKALNIFRAAPNAFDIVFMDMQMPVMDGLEATRRIRALDIPRAKTVPIIAMTANVFREDVDNCLEAGMQSHLGKPLDMDEVLGILKQYLS